MIVVIGKLARTVKFNPDGNAKESLQTLVTELMEFVETDNYNPYNNVMMEMK